MGTINYGKSEFVTVAYNSNFDICKIKREFDFSTDSEAYDEIDLWAEEDKNEIQTVLDTYDFYYFCVTIRNGYYDGFYIDIKNCFIEYDNYSEKQAAQKEITQIKKFLLECVEYGLCVVRPGWVTAYLDRKDSIKEIKDAIKEMRTEVKNTPTYRTLNRKEAIV